MVQEATGSGAAHDATVRTDLSIAELQEMLGVKLAEQEETQLARNVEAAQAKVDKIKGHLADAEQALDDAKAALAAAEGN